MRKLITILALLGLATGFAALTANADTVSYTVDGTFSADPIFPSTSLSNPGDAFTLTFSVPSNVLGPNPLPSGMSGNIPVMFTYTDITTPSLSFSQACTPNAVAPCLNFFTPSQGGLFGIQFTDASGNLFMFELFGPGCFTTPGPSVCGGYNDGTPPTLITGNFTIDDTLSVLGEVSPSCVSPAGSFCADDISGTVTATSSAAVPEPSSLLLLGSGFLALGGFARRRLGTLIS